jgi:hypothetical protein
MYNRNVRECISTNNDGGRGGPGWAMVPPKIRKKIIRSKKNNNKIKKE